MPQNSPTSMTLVKYLNEQLLKWWNENSPIFAYASDCPNEFGICHHLETPYPFREKAGEFLEEVYH